MAVYCLLLAEYGKRQLFGLILFLHYKHQHQSLTIFETHKNAKSEPYYLLIMLEYHHQSCVWRNTKVRYAGRYFQSAWCTNQVSAFSRGLCILAYVIGAASPRLLCQARGGQVVEPVADAP
jgi:hypothetical protein